ncbi:MAG: helix-turn-helix transcriptional regulator [Elusimicrobia bacterium]|nr:helix-turn-helix transcriptional regulator [Elusimicrobiota bacterium]
MKKRAETGLDADVMIALRDDPEYAAEYFEELSRRPLPVQVALLRRLLGMSQHELAVAMGMRQTHVSRLEKAGSDHLLSLYERAAVKLGARVALIPERMALAARRPARR